MQPFRDAQVDAEHDWIITFFDALREQGQLGKGDAKLDAELTHCLLHYLTRHCQREEALMHIQGYEDAERHAEAHRILQQEFRCLLLPRLEGHLSLDDDLRLVRGLFLRHIVTWDEAFGDWLAHGVTSIAS